MSSRGEFARCFVRLQGDFLAYILAIGVPPQDADDILQNAAASMFEKFETYEPGTNFRAWGFAFIRHEALHYFRTHSRRSLRFSEETLSRIGYLAEEEAEIPETRQKFLNICLQKLHDTAKRVLFMRYRDDLPAPEIARILKRPTESIHTALSKARQFLRNCVERLEKAEGMQP